MKILVHDYSGHPFQVQLSRELARRGHEVLHQHFAGFQTPKGHLTRSADDRPGFATEALNLSTAFAKHSFVSRQRHAVADRRLAAECLKAFVPNVVLASNLPLDPLRLVQLVCHSVGATFYVWLQDIYSAAMTRILSQRLPIVGRL